MKKVDKKFRYYLKVLPNTGSVYFYVDVQEANMFKIENGMVIFMDINEDRMHVVTAMYPAANIIIERIREIN